MCTVLLPPGVNPTAVNKYNRSYHMISYTLTFSGTQLKRETKGWLHNIP